MTNKLILGLAQVDLIVGDVSGNTAKILEYADRARDELQADIAVFPELSICGYPPEDLLFHSGLLKRVEHALDTIRTTVRDIAVIVGFPEYDSGNIYNACLVFHNGKVLAHYRKHMLPNYRVFDEERYFTAGKDAAVFHLKGLRIGLNICEDVWRPGPAAAARAGGAEAIIAINGSPYELRSQQIREDVVRKRISEVGIPFVYVNMVGGQDELVFDGGSFAMDRDGKVTFRAPPYEEKLLRIELQADASGVRPETLPSDPVLDTEPSVYGAIVTGTRDYVNKNGFPGVVLGLSGGIDSALILAIACDALGADRVRAVMMPFRYTSAMSQEDAAMQARTLGVRYDVLPIEPMYDATVATLKSVFEGRAEDVTEENIQARCRGILLMAISNKTARMLLTTGNKTRA